MEFGGCEVIFLPSSQSAFALALDEQRYDFIPTLWQARPNLDLQQVWFAGSHSDIGGSYKPDIPTQIHESVKTRYLNDEKYRPPNLVEYLAQNNWPEQLEN